MPIKWNPGDFNHRITLLKPSEPTRDEMGGYVDPTFDPQGTVWAKINDKSASYQQVIGDYVTVQTKYFIVRDITKRYDINTSWRLLYNGFVFVINSLTLMDDSVPYYIQIEATALGGNKPL